VLENGKSLSDIVSANNITLKKLQNWEKTFLSKVGIAMEPPKAVKEYKIESSAAQE